MRKRTVVGLFVCTHASWGRHCGHMRKTARPPRPSPTRRPSRPIWRSSSTTRPAGKKPTSGPAIVFFFGGGWAQWHDQAFETQASHLASRGMVAARADYRVKSRQGVTPRNASRMPRVRSDGSGRTPPSWASIPSRIVAAGGSAGGHIAACTALTPGLEAEGEDTTDLVQAQRPGPLQSGAPVQGIPR